MSDCSDWRALADSNVSSSCDERKCKRLGPFLYFETLKGSLVMAGPWTPGLKLERPPLEETVIGVQFDTLRNFTIAHYGWYWKKCLDESWDRTLDVPPLVDVFERFDDQARWNLPKFVLQDSALPNRIQIIHNQDDRVIQIQNTRFIYNWRKRATDYPRFEVTFPEFVSAFGKFQGFIRDAGLGPLSINQWEVSYVNHIPRGDLWESPSDWNRVLPTLFPRGPSSEYVSFESCSGEWHHVIQPKRGRLHVAVQHGKPRVGNDEVLILQLTARGPVDTEKSGWDLEAGLRLGHEVIVRTFFQLMSLEAQDYWGRRQP